MRSWMALLALVLSACGAPADRGNSVRIGITLEPPNLDPTAGAAAAIDEVVYANVFEGLTRIGRKGEVLPALAERWDVSDDRLTYVFHLRRGVRFHDGTAFDADDVVFSFDRARAAGSTNAQKAFFGAILSVAAIDPATVEVKLTKPVGDFLFYLGFGDAAMVAPESADANAVTPVGTGPFRFDRWLRGTQIELVRFDGYWGPKAALDRAVFVVVPDPGAAYAALLAGDIDSFPFFPAPELLPQIEGDGRFTIGRGTTEGETILAINNARPPFDDVRVRRAIQMAINRKDVIAVATEGYGVPIGSFFPPHDPAAVDLTGLAPFDPAKAKALMAEAGHGAGFDAVLRLPPVAYARRGGEVVAQQLRAIGIRVTLEPIEWAQWLDQVYGRADYDLTIVAHTEPRDIAIFGRDGYYLNYARPEFQALMARLELLGEGPERLDVLRAAQTMLAEDAAAGFLFQLPKTGVWNARLTGQWIDAPVQANDLTDVRWAR